MELMDLRRHVKLRLVRFNLIRWTPLSIRSALGMSNVNFNLGVDQRRRVTMEINVEEL